MGIWDEWTKCDLLKCENFTLDLLTYTRESFEESFIYCALWVTEQRISFQGDEVSSEEEVDDEEEEYSDEYDDEETSHKRKKRKPAHGGFIIDEAGRLLLP